MHRGILRAAILRATAALAVFSMTAIAAADDLATCATEISDAAIAACSRLIQRNPSYATLYNNRGVDYMSRGDNDRAIADFTQAIRLNPQDAKAYGNRGIAYGKKGDNDRAIADFTQAIRLNPRGVDTYYNRGTIYHKKGQYDRAIADLTQAVRLNPQYDMAFNNRGLSYDRKGEYELAVADYEQALRLNPDNAEARSNKERVRLLTAAPMGGPIDPQWEKPLPPVPAQPGAVSARLPAGPGVGVELPETAPIPEQPAVLVQPPAPAMGQPAKRALVIGIDAYPNLGRVAQLERAVADAEAVGDKLASLGFQVTRITTARQATLDTMLRSFGEFRKTIGRNDMVVLFYAGHGMGLSDGTYLLPADFTEGSLEAEELARRAAINENELTNGLRTRAGIVIAVIDACRNDLFSRSATRSVGNERGLRPVETEGIFKLYSASEGQTALDRLPGSDASKNSVFTRVFLKAVGRPGLNLSLLGTTVRDEVYGLARSVDHAQTPAVYDKLIGSTQVYFAGEAATAEHGAQ
jgi:tetratricopeptide (TPR) repeat protein